MAGANVSERLRDFVSRIQALQRDKKAIVEDIRAVFEEARDAQFDTKILRDIIKRAAMTAEERDEYDGMVQVYSAALGILGDTPLGAAAVRKLNVNQLADDRTTPEGQTDLEDAIDEKKGKKKKKTPNAREVPGIGIVTDLDIANARAEGRKAAKSGEQLPEANKYAPHDPRRAAFDEGWCSQAKSTGMAIPDAFRRKSDIEKDRKSKLKEQQEREQEAVAKQQEKTSKKEEAARKKQAAAEERERKRAEKEAAKAAKQAKPAKPKEPKPKAAKKAATKKSSTKKGGNGSSSPWQKTDEGDPAAMQQTPSPDDAGAGAEAASNVDEGHHNSD